MVDATAKNVGMKEQPNLNANDLKAREIHGAAA